MSKRMTNKTDLIIRSKLPEDMQVFVREFPRAMWEAQTGPFTAIYLERHHLFRKMINGMIRDSEAFLNDDFDPLLYRKSISRLGTMLLSELQTHDQLEHDHYFPVIEGLDPRTARSFDMLEKDHDVMHDVLDRFQHLGNTTIAALDGETRFQKADMFLTSLRSTERLILRHLDDEEDIIVPIMLKHGEECIDHLSSLITS